MRFCILFILVLTVLNIQSQEYESILWNHEQRLNWDDFRAKPPTSSRAAATTASGISYQFSTLENEGKFELDYSVDTFFYPDKSWYYPDVCDEVILSHEQLHFDISELFARKMRKLLNETTFSKNVKAEVRVIYGQINKELAEFQNVYDADTNYSRNREKQLLWNKKIAEALDY